MCAISRLKVQPAKFSSFFQWLRRLTRPNQASQRSRIGGGLRCKFRDLWEAFSCSVCIGQSRCARGRLFALARRSVSATASCKAATNSVRVNSVNRRATAARNCCSLVPDVMRHAISAVIGSAVIGVLSNMAQLFVLSGFGNKASALGFSISAPHPGQTARAGWPAAAGSCFRTPLCCWVAP
jgi:hypothetical protein